MKRVVSKKGAIVLPAGMRRRDGVRAGDEFEVLRVGRGEYRLVRRERVGSEGLADWLLACPVKGYFVGIESESTGVI